MKSKYTLFVLLSLVALAVGCFWQLSSKGLKPAPQAVTVAEQHASTTFPSDALQYDVNIDSSIVDDKGNIVSYSVFTWTMRLEALVESSQLEGRLYQAKFTQNEKSIDLPSMLPFKVQRHNNQFKALNMLGLPSDHVLHVLKQIFWLMSYDEKSPLEFNDGVRKLLVSYQRDGQKLSRTVLQEQYLHAQKPANEQEDWVLRLGNNDQVETLNFVSQREWREQSQRYAVKQSVTVMRSAQNLAAISMVADAQANVHITSDADKQAILDNIANENEFLSALEQLKQSIDGALAKNVGDYLLSHYSSAQIIQLLNSQSGSGAAIIYALQKVQSPAAELMLVDLLQTQELQDMDQHRVAIALGRFGASSSVGLNALISLSRSEAQTANTALLSLGSMAHFSQSQAHSVSAILGQHLSQRTSLPTTIMAIANSRDEQLIAQLPPFLQDQDDSVKLNAIKVLSREGGFQDQVVNALISAPQTKFVDAFVREFSQSQHALSAHNYNRLQLLAANSNNPILVKKLTEFLASMKS